MKRKLLILLTTTFLFNFSIAFAQESLITSEDKSEENIQTIDTQESVKVAGIREIAGKKYYFDDHGNMQTGFVTIDGKIYFFSRTYGYALQGWVSNFEGKWYQTEDGSLLTGIQEIDGKRYYFGEDGKLVTGFVTIDGKIYFFSRTYDYALQGWVSNFEGKWYQQEDGSLLTGIQEIDGKKYYFGEDGKLVTGFATIDGKIYFFSRTYDYALQGWVSNFEGKWYQTEEGSLLTGIQEIDGKRYYFGEDGKLVTGFTTIDGKVYFFSRTYDYALQGWVSNFEGKWYQTEDGSLLTGIQEIDGKRYYFGEDGKLVTGFTTIDGKIYFFSRTYDYALQGWVSNFEGKWYQAEDGSLLTGIQMINGKKYYFGEDGKIVTGFVTIDNKTYFFSPVDDYAPSGVVKQNNKAWYQTEDGEIIENDGLLVLDGKEYYFDGTELKSGFQTIDDKTYYFDENTYEKRYDNITNQYAELVLNHETGEYVKKQYHPVYYRQKDSRWNNKKYGLGTMGMTGCAPTGMAMAYTAILQREVLPTEVANFLYYNTDQFNRRLKGTSGMGIIHASNYFNVKWTGIGTKEEMIDALKQGKIVYASMQNGKFAKPTYNHIIIMYNYNENLNRTYTLDPLTQLNNGWTDVDLIWREQCMDPDDRTGGYAFYGLEEK